MKGDRTYSALRQILFILIFFPLGLFAQKEKKLQINGYVKYLHSQTYVPLSFSPVPGAPPDTTLAIFDNLVHNRLNIHYLPGKRWKIALETRNRLFYGDQMRFPGYSDRIDTYNGLVDLSIRWVDQGGYMLHSIIDRAYVNYSYKKWDVTLGRQRINWGVNMVWNPNDLFNAYNFLDFDYEERPGSDAIRIQYFPGLVSRAELAFAPDDTLENSVAAALYRFNVKEYDIQTIAGYYRGDLAVGGGWEGNIWNLGFKGEGTYFHSTEASADSTNSFGGSVSLDYMFGKGIYLIGSTLYNSDGGAAGTAQGGIVGGQLTARNLFPAKWAFFAQGSAQPYALLSSSVGAIYAPDGNLLILIPNLSYSIASNWQLDLIGQLFFADSATNWRHQGSGVFLRLKWSY